MAKTRESRAIGLCANKTAPSHGGYSVPVQENPFSFDALRHCEHLFKRLKFVGKLVADFYNLTGCLGVGTAAIVHGNEGRSKDKRAALTFCRNQITVSAFVGLLRPSLTPNAPEAAVYSVLCIGRAASSP